MQCCKSSLQHPVLQLVLCPESSHERIGSGQGELGGLIMCDDVRYTARATQLNNFRVVTPVSELMSTVKIIHKHITPSQFHQSSLVCGSSFVIKPDGIVRWMMDIY